MSATITCSRCQGQGHYAIDCTNNVSHNVTRRVITCSFCQQQGHNRRTCPVKIQLNRNVTIRPKRNNKKEKKETHTDDNEDHTCSICFDDCKQKSCELGCGHKFHTSCIFNWFSRGTNTCPMCRAEVKEMKRSRKIKLPPVEAWGAFERMVREMINTDPLTRSEYSRAIYMVFKSRLEGMCDSEYEEFLSLGI